MKEDCEYCEGDGIAEDVRGRTVRCECLTDEEWFGPEGPNYEEVNDRAVVFNIGDNGVGRIEVLW